MLTHLIPNAVPTSDRTERLEAAKADKRHHEIIMKHTRKRGDLTAYANAKRNYGLSCALIDAWELTTHAGEVA